jgi:hypothetical protein
MSNNEKDDFIRKALQSDKVIPNVEEVSKKVKKEIDVSQIKLKKHTFGERRFIRFLCVVLCISLSSNIYLIKNRQNNLAQAYDADSAYIATAQDNIDLEKAVISNIAVENVEDENAVTENAVVENTAVENTINEVASNTEKNTVVASAKNENTVNSTDIDEEVLKDELTRYAMTIGRFDDNNDVLEKNTILLLIANGYFNSKVSQNVGLKVSQNSEYAMTVSNVNLFIKELIGANINTYLNSYTNYIKYNDLAKSYASAEKSTSLNSEKYELSNLQITSSSNANEYIVKGNINRKSQADVVENKVTVTKDMNANYDLEAVISLNSKYSYIPYLIKSYKAVLKEGEEDIVNRLADLENQTAKK